ncbi:MULTISPECIES: toprim domain-containing protein [unclassified Streptomyces]|uniref:toprim domain-containing protein n=1 Tax=unclassified Streptomyces TaxID=2593676 RepID=UPI000AB0FE79|nr:MULTISPECIES: toprim domain-containing protein [unclassified Streptomyces]
MKRKSGQMPGSVEAAKLYQGQYLGSPAEEYLVARGLGEGAKKWLPGFVGDSVTVGHEQYRDHLVIPYLRPAGTKFIATVRFRCLSDRCVKDSDGQYHFLKGQKEDHGSHSKYQTLPADTPRLYNTAALIVSSPYVAISEGEFSAWAVELDGIPSVALQGVSAWKDHFDRAFAGYEKVFLLGDGDEAGKSMNKKLAERLPNGVPVQFPDGEDPDSLRRQYGDGSIRQLLGLEG